ncbi:MAG: GTPase CgtA, partial [Clostridiales bacterium]|nr:GTPase CgtA [Clostridiales bacterium]
MNFVDIAKIYVKAGNGGDGAASFHREKYITRGGPDGGDGGSGGNIVFIADENMNTLLDFKFMQHYSAENGENGKKKLQTGKNGEDLVIRVPVGTIVRDLETYLVVADMIEPEKQRIV